MRWDLRSRVRESAPAAPLRGPRLWFFRCLRCPDPGCSTRLRATKCDGLALRAGPGPHRTPHHQREHGDGVPLDSCDAP